MLKQLQSFPVISQEGKEEYLGECRNRERKLNGIYISYIYIFFRYLGTSVHMSMFLEHVDFCHLAVYQGSI